MDNKSKEQEQLKYYAIAVRPGSEADFFIQNFLALNAPLTNAIIGEKGYDIEHRRMVYGLVKSAVYIPDRQPPQATKKPHPRKSASGKDSQNIQLSLDIEL